MLVKGLKILFLFIFLSQSLLAQEALEGYQGYRLDVFGVKLVKKKSSYIKIDCKLYNTGREAIAFNADLPKSLIVNFDEDFLESKEGKSYASYIKNAILSSGKSIKSGGSLSLSKFKVSIPKGAVQQQDAAFEVTLGADNEGQDFQRDRCSDLRIDSIFVIKKTKRYAIIGYILTNHGTGAVSLEGTSDPYDNVGIEAYFTGAPKLGRGALVSGRFFITKALKESNGILFPGKQYTGKLKISLSKKTRYTASLILFVDAQGVIIECDETNNTSYIIMP